MLPIKTVEFFWLNCLKQPVRIDERPSSVNEVDSFPPWGSLDVRQGFPFLPKKMKFTEFFFRQGEAAKRQTIFASLCASTMRQGEALTKARITLFAEENFASKILWQGEALECCRKNEVH